MKRKSFIHKDKLSPDEANRLRYTFLIISKKVVTPSHMTKLCDEEDCSQCAFNYDHTCLLKEGIMNSYILLKGDI